MDELGYLPNTQARRSVSGRSRILGMIVSEITNPFFPELVQEFENLAVAQGYEVMIGSTNHESGRHRVVACTHATAQCGRCGSDDLRH